METTARAGVGSMCMRVVCMHRYRRPAPGATGKHNVSTAVAQAVRRGGPFEPGGPRTVASVLTQRAAHALLETGDDGCW